ncbi:site-specific integrase [Bosea sp. UNC402CLCol]|uniref:tyrosine-type recombinase/integrase n=1 Tax=Bosea sp. UNC402CLCol TaxID=1510531 RepID=UPI00056F87D6|nr:site-specific integrase [Bosea sp. UNC402CLCol]
MARKIQKLSALAVKTLTKPGRHSDGNGLYLVVDASGARRWLFLFRWEGKLKEMGLGGTSAVTLAQARAKADEARRELDAGRNPILSRQSARSTSAAVPTFGDFADTLISEISEGFRNVKHQAQWKSTIKTYAAAMRSKRVDEINTNDVLGVLRPIWLTKSETASRVRGRIEKILDAARSKGLRSGENPARWRGHLANLLPKQNKLSRGHHAAMPFDDVPAFIVTLRVQEGVAARALEFCLLNASRTNEVLGALWSEIDWADKIWTVPAERMKNAKPHRVPLSSQALKILTSMKADRVSDFVFPGAKKDRPLSNMAMEMVLRRMEVGDATVHGFRSSFRDWAGERTNFAREVVEVALSHTIGDETERAYRRADALEKRRKLMEEWARFVGSPKAEKKTGSRKRTKSD